MDFGSHLLSGIAICLATPNNPDPKSNLIEKGLIMIGSVVPDLPVNLIWRHVGKKVGKSVLKIKLTERDYETHAGSASPWLQVYKVLHSFIFLIVVIIIETWLLGRLFLSLGIFIHQVCDLFTHKYRTNILNPKPVYPFGFTWPWGITNGWRWKWYHFATSWVIHIAIILAILFYKDALP